MYLRSGLCLRACCPILKNPLYAFGPKFWPFGPQESPPQMTWVLCRAGGRTPRTPRSGGLILHRRAVLGTPKCEKSGGRWGSAPDPTGGAYSAPPDPIAGWGGAPRGLCCPLPKNPTYNIVIVLVLCVCTHVYENALVRGASQLYLAVASNYLAPALVR